MPRVTTVLPLPEAGAAITTALANQILPQACAIPVEQRAPFGDATDYDQRRRGRLDLRKKVIDFAELRLEHRLVRHGRVGNDCQRVGRLPPAFPQGPRDLA